MNSLLEQKQVWNQEDTPKRFSRIPLQGKAKKKQGKAKKKLVDDFYKSDTQTSLVDFWRKNARDYEVQFAFVSDEVFYS